MVLGQQEKSSAVTFNFEITTFSTKVIDETWMKNGMKRN
jgi:hypothetical protein